MISFDTDLDETSSYYRKREAVFTMEIFGELIAFKKMTKNQELWRCDIVTTIFLPFSTYSLLYSTVPTGLCNN